LPAEDERVSQDLEVWLAREDGKPFHSGRGDEVDAFFRNDSVACSHGLDLLETEFPGQLRSQTEFGNEVGGTEFGNEVNEQTR